MLLSSVIYYELYLSGRHAEVRLSTAYVHTWHHIASLQLCSYLTSHCITSTTFMFGITLHHSCLAIECLLWWSFIVVGGEPSHLGEHENMRSMGIKECMVQVCCARRNVTRGLDHASMMLVVCDVGVTDVERIWKEQNLDDILFNYLLHVPSQ